MVLRNYVDKDCLLMEDRGEEPFVDGMTGREIVRPSVTILVTVGSGFQNSNSVSFLPVSSG